MGPDTLKCICGGKILIIPVGVIKLYPNLCMQGSFAYFLSSEVFLSKWKYLVHLAFDHMLIVITTIGSRS